MLERSQDLYSFIRDFIEKNEYSPSFRDIQKGCEYSSTSMIKADLEELKEKGLIKYEEGKARTIRTTETHHHHTIDLEL